MARVQSKAQSKTRQSGQKNKLIGSLDRGKMEFLDLSSDFGIHKVSMLKYGTKGITMVTLSTRGGASLAMFIRISSPLFNSLATTNVSFGQLVIKVSPRGSFISDSELGYYRFNGSTWEFINDSADGADYNDDVEDDVEDDVDDDLDDDDGDESHEFVSVE